MRVDSIDQLDFGKQFANAPQSSFSKKLILRWLDGFSKGHLTLIDGNERLEFDESKQQATIHATIKVNHARAYWHILKNGTLGAGESYMNGDWSSDDLTNVIELMVANMDALQNLNGKRGVVAKTLSLITRVINANSLLGSRRNIAAHYDLGNDFFKLFLDPTMMYSSAIYQHQSQSLQEASVNKLQRICEKLDLQPSDHLLEIGTGWGGLAIHAAKHFGCQVTTTTLSKEQHDYAVEAIEAEALSDKITVVMQDYRELRGKYNKLVSVEMIEAVGHEFLPSYFKQCNDLLTDDGIMLIQAITIADQRYHWYRKSTDFIQKYIFPGGCLPSTEIISQHLAKHTQMQLVHLEDITKHYAQTLKDWRLGFFAQMDAVKEQGYPQWFIRMWEYYLCYCEGGFNARSIQTGQYVFAKAQSGALLHLNKL